MNYTDLITFYGTKDIEATTAFYQDLLGLRLASDQGKCRIFEVAEHGLIAFCEHLDVTHTHKSPLLTFVLDDIDGCFNKLKDHCEVIEAPKRNDQFHLYHFFILDNNGYTLEFQKFLDPNWNQLKAADSQ